MSKKRIKQYLMLLTVVGLVAIAAGGGNGTFASFSAETTNANNTFATGTLFLHNTANGGTVCASETGSLNVNSNCDVLFNVSSIKPGATASQADLTLTNAGTIDASDIKFFGGTCTDGTPTLTTLTAAATSGATSVTVAALPQALAAGTPIKIGSDTFKVGTAGAAANATAIPLSSAVPAGGESNGAVVQIDTSGIGSASLCSGLKLHVIETDSGFTTNESCAYGPALCDFNSGFTTAIGSLPPSGTPATLSLASNFGGNTAGGGQGLNAGKSRYFVIEVQAPNTLGDTAQNATAKFDLTWHIDQ